jgi:hypothetical protein
MSSKYNSPAILATVRGDASSIGSIIAPPADDKDKRRGQNPTGRLRPPRSSALLICATPLVPVKRVLEAARIPGPTVLVAPIRLPLTDGRL